MTPSDLSDSYVPGISDLFNEIAALTSSGGFVDCLVSYDKERRFPAAVLFQGVGIPQLGRHL